MHINNNNAFAQIPENRSCRHLFTFTPSRLLTVKTSVDGEWRGAKGEFEKKLLKMFIFFVFSCDRTTYFSPTVDGLLTDVLVKPWENVPHPWHEIFDGKRFHIENMNLGSTWHQTNSTLYISPSWLHRLWVQMMSSDQDGSTRTKGCLCKGRKFVVRHHSIPESWDFYAFPTLQRWRHVHSSHAMASISTGIYFHKPLWGGKCSNTVQSKIKVGTTL